MNSLKKNDIPPDIHTYPGDVATSVNDLYKFQGKVLSVLLHDNDTDLSLVACDRVYDLAFYAVESRVLPSYTHEDSLELLRVKVINPANLPYELNYDEEAFVIYDGWEYTVFYNMEDVVDYIESTFRIYARVDIEKDFIVLIGREQPKSMFNLLLLRMEDWSARLKREKQYATRSILHSRQR